MSRVRPNIPFMGWRRPGLIVSAVISVAAVVAVITMGLNLSVDFTGGALWNLRFDQPVTEEAVRTALAAAGQADAGVQRVGAAAEGGGTDYVIRTGAISADERQLIETELRQGLAQFTVVSLDEVSPVIGEEIRRNAFLALAIAAVAMIIYITIRFEYRFAVAAIIGLVHDILMVLGVFAVLRLSVDAAFVAAILTVFGYSINDTIIVYDRIRENRGNYGRGQLEALVNDSVNQTLSRTINTSLTTILAIAAVAVFGGPTLQNFAIAIVIGIITGTYSSIFIASALWLEWRLRDASRRPAAA